MNRDDPPHPDVAHLVPQLERSDREKRRDAEQMFEDALVKQAALIPDIPEWITDAVSVLVDAQRDGSIDLETLLFPFVEAAADLADEVRGALDDVGISVPGDAKGRGFALGMLGARMEDD